MNYVLTALQAAGLLAVLVGLWLALPLWAALTADGSLVVVAATAAEVVVSRARSAGGE